MLSCNPRGLRTQRVFFLSVSARVDKDFLVQESLRLVLLEDKREFEGNGHRTAQYLRQGLESTAYTSTMGR